MGPMNIKSWLFWAHIGVLTKGQKTWFGPSPTLWTHGGCRHRYSMLWIWYTTTIFSSVAVFMVMLFFCIILHQMEFEIYFDDWMSLLKSEHSPLNKRSKDQVRAHPNIMEVVRTDIQCCEYEIPPQYFHWKIFMWSCFSCIKLTSRVKCNLNFILVIWWLCLSERFSWLLIASRSGQSHQGSLINDCWTSL